MSNVKMNLDGKAGKFCACDVQSQIRLGLAPGQPNEAGKAEWPNSNNTF